MRVHVTDLKPGDLLINDVYNNAGLHMLVKGSTLSEDDIAKLLQHGIDYADVEHTPSDLHSDEQTLRSDQTRLLTNLFEDTIKGTEMLFEQAMEKGFIDESQVDHILVNLTSQLEKQKDVVSLLLMMDGDNEYTYTHSLQVGMLAFYIAGWMGYNPEECLTVAKAGYLHDIGKSKIPPEMLHKPGKLTPEEFEEMKKHTLYGYEIIMESTQDELLATVALQHHEREDGSGYPYGLKRDEIHPYSRITAVADVYSAMTTNRVYQTKQELISVLCELYSLSFGQLNGEVTQELIKHMLPNFIGKRVLLTTGQTGLIVMNNPADYFRPLVQTSSAFIDLAKERDVAIVEIYVQ
ncbi:HD-GYP domain-containing protein [Paenibacillus tundrae]|uniref:Nucleotidyltransferase with HDIG domain n=1 Tax=Paenibacillus tundrae TaxID=528187 RepID=A0ABT9WCS0_9BACL|nr:HD-GYP domain-containing protein [Paenibacillus tundrae]MDQ0170869.1 putative nucleotidyltransferase with HDIG domain [Paenibacillus tundrae]